jgi:hypothetical protein
MLLQVHLARMLFMFPSVTSMTSGSVGMVRRFLMLAAFMMASGFGMMLGSVGVML